MKIGSVLGNIWPGAVKKVSPVEKSTKKPTSDDPSRETSDYTEQKKSETYGVYDKKGKVTPFDID
ncbi:MAG: hypothetical protein ACRBB3_07415 [Alphaproteobacteria bacterium]